MAAWLERCKPGFRVGAVVALGIAVVSSPWWGPQTMSHLSFFRMRRVEIHGLVYLPRAELMQRLAVDTTGSIWMDLGVLRGRIADHPQLIGVSLSRKLPGTLVVRVQERQPVALVQRKNALAAVDAEGEVLPLDPSMSDVNVPVLRSADSSILRFLAELRENEPKLFSRVSEVTREGRDELRIQLFTFPVRAMTDVTVARLLDIIPVERDLTAKGIRVAELDLRFRGQVIARTK
jgi:cell division protein FtsQ